MTAVLLALALGAGTASVPTSAALAQKVQVFYETTRDLEAHFTQTYTYGVGGRRLVSRGVLRVKKPGKLRWDYAEPEKKIIVVNGSRLTQYEPEVNQAYVDPRFDASAMSAAVTFLLGQGRLDKEFELAAEGADRLVLTPKKPDARVARVLLTVGASGEVTATRVEDGSGNSNDIAFQGLRRNVGMSEGTFALALPKDVRFVRAPGGG